MLIIEHLTKTYGEKKAVDDLLLRINYSCSAVHGTVPFRVLAGESIADLNKH